MTEPRLISLIVCARVEPGPPLRALDLRRQWPTPPDSFWLIADIENPTEQSFSWEVWMSRRGELLDRSGETLELASPGQFFLPAELRADGVEPRKYMLHWLLNGKERGKIGVDFGFPEASP